jgi:hypothetical protein
MMKATCPKCGWTNTRRSSRTKLADRVLKLFFLSPYRCRTCLNRFYSFNNSSSRNRTEMSGSRG